MQHRFTVCPIHCVAIHTITLTIWETHLYDPNMLSPKLEGSTLQPQMDCLSS